MKLVLEDTRPSQVLTREAFENAISAIAATGGSTNGVLHLLAIAAEAGRRALDRRLRHDLGAHADRRRHQARRPLRRDRPLQGGRRRASSRASSCAAASSTRTSPESTVERCARSPTAPTSGRPGRRRLLGRPAQGHRRAGDPARQPRAGRLRREARRPRARPPSRACARLRLGGSLLRRRQGARDRAGRRDRDPLRGAGRRPRHARDAARHGVARGRGSRRRGRPDHRRPLLRRDPRADGRARRTRGVPRRADRARPRRRHDRRRRRNAAARRSRCRGRAERRAAEWTQPEPRYATGVFAKYAAAVGSASEGATHDERCLAPMPSLRDGVPDRSRAGSACAASGRSSRSTTGTRSA